MILHSAPVSALKMISMYPGLKKVSGGMAEYINKDKVVDGLSYIRSKWDEAERAFKDYLNGFPAADVVDVVRCKDCKHYEFADNRAFGFPVRRCEWTGFEDIDEDDFCSRGEKKE